MQKTKTIRFSGDNADNGTSTHLLHKIGGRWYVDGDYQRYKDNLRSGRPVYELPSGRRIRPTVYPSVWVPVYVPGLRPGESVCRHRASGKIWCSLDGYEILSDPEELAKELTVIGDAKLMYSILKAVL